MSLSAALRFVGIVFCSILFSSISLSQWAELVLPEQLALFSSVTCPMGDDCMIFTVDTSNTLHGFDQNSKAWSEYTANTTLDWVTGYGGGKVCMVLNDSVVVAYSSLLSQFKELRFDGTLLTLPGSGWTSCNDYYGVIMTTERIYVYDAQSNDWNSVAMIDYGSLSGFSNHIQDDYISVMMSFENYDTRVVAYSLQTKTFDEITKYNLNLTRLDHGLCGIAYSSSTYIIGYSAYTGSFSEENIIVPGENFEWSVPATDNDKVTELVVCMFFKRSALDVGGNVTLSVYVYNTLTGAFYSHPYTYPYSATSYYTVVGGKFTAMAMYNVSDYKVTLEMFRVSDNTFYSLDVPIYIIASTPGCLTVGEEVFWIWDDTHLIAVNATTGTTGQVSFNDSFVTLPPLMATMAGDDWGVWAYRNTASDTVKIFYFSGDVTSIGYKEEYASLGVTQAQYDKLGFIMFQDAGYGKKWSAYSPSYNAWHDFESTTSSSDYQTVPRNYMYVNYVSKGKLELFDAVTNDVRIYPHLTNVVYSINKGNHLTVYNSVHQYVGYSAVEHDDQTYQVDNYYGLGGNDDIVAITPTGALLTTYTGIIYDGYRNNFAGLKIADSLGTSVSGGQSGKFCFYATMTGHVFAYTGDDGNVVHVEQSPSNYPIQFSLDQNYPNPFNPKTIIRYQVLAAGHVSIKVIDLLGREVATLVNEKKPSGSYQVPWYASGFASGVYFYQLKINNFVETRKMLLMK